MMEYKRKQIIIKVFFKHASLMKKIRGFDVLIFFKSVNKLLVV